MEVETAARRKLLKAPSVTGYVQDRVFKFTLAEHVAGTGRLAVVLRRSDGWAQPDRVQTSEYPILVVDCWADPDRDDDGRMVRSNAIDKAYALYRVIDREFHAKRDEWWGAGGGDPGMRVVTSVRWREPFHLHGDNGHGTAGGVGPTSTPIQDCAVATVAYALHVAH